MKRRGKGSFGTIEQENWDREYIYTEADTDSSHNHSEDTGGEFGMRRCCTDSFAAELGGRTQKTVKSKGRMTS
jgi:hypothetical protein